MDKKEKNKLNMDYNNQKNKKKDIFMELMKNNSTTHLIKQVKWKVSMVTTSYAY